LTLSDYLIPLRTKLPNTTFSLRTELTPNTRFGADGRCVKILTLRQEDVDWDLSETSTCTRLQKADTQSLPGGFLMLDRKLLRLHSDCRVLQTSGDP
jgi:hypothetical protein